MLRSNKLQRYFCIVAVFALLILFVGLVCTDVAITADLSATVVKQPVADTYVASGHSKESFHGEKAVWAGYNKDGYQVERTLFKFDLAEIPAGSTIQSAVIFLYLGGTTPNDTPMDVVISRIVNDQGSPNWLNEPTEALTWERHLLLQPIDVNATTNPVRTAFIEYQWNLQKLVQDWANSNPRTTYLGLLLQGNEKDDRRHERSFWSKDCKISNECTENQRPRLELQYALPPATPTPTSVPTATPTPPFAQLTLRHAPTGEIKPNQTINYTLHYQIGPNADLAGVKIRSVIPNNVKLLTDTISPSQDVTYTGLYAGALITWTLGSQAHNQEGELSYQVCRPTVVEHKSCTDPVAVVADSPILNDGAQLLWTPKHATDPGSAPSNATLNPALYLYLPFVGNGPKP